ncbi:MAG: hypothetical protein AAGE52_07235 [Myxococcota bacterium]
MRAILPCALVFVAMTPAYADDAYADDATADDEEDVTDVTRALADASTRANVRTDGLVLGLDFGSAFLTATADGSSRSLSLQYGFHIGYRYNDWTILFYAEHGLWRAPELGGQAWQHAANIGIGFERFYVSAFLRTMLIAGTSILLRSNDLDDRGEVGIFVDLRPLGIHWQFSDRGAFVLDLLHFAFVAPVLTGIPLADIQFRSSVGVEARF